MITISIYRWCRRYVDAGDSDVFSDIDLGYRWPCDVETGDDVIDIADRNVDTGNDVIDNADRNVDTDKYKQRCC